jgi:murein L,D-transpeptidase YcbB/YkuD
MCPKIPEFVDPRRNPVDFESIIPDLLEEIRRGHLSIRQSADGKNSLGLVKSTFSTEIDVSRYDTPATEVFEK